MTLLPHLQQALPALHNKCHRRRALSPHNLVDYKHAKIPPWHRLCITRIALCSLARHQTLTADPATALHTHQTDAPAHSTRLARLCNTAPVSEHTHLLRRT